MNGTLNFAAVIIAAVSCSAASGHEFWIQPASYTPAAGAAVRIELHHGERFLGERVPRRADLIDRFTIVGPQGESPVVGRSGGEASFGRVASPGIHVIGYRSRRMVNHLDAAAFEAYLHEEGLAHISAIRAERGERARPGHEVYSRCAKALIAVDGVVTGGDRELGLPLEIMLETDPAALEAGAVLVAQVKFRGRPLAGVTVVAASAQSPEKLLRLETDFDGRVRVALSDAGPWMLTTIHMVQAPPEVDADWESFWGSLTFACRPARS